MKRSKRRRASSIADSVARSLTSCRPSSRTVRTMSATRSWATLPSSSADRDAVMTAPNFRLSLVMGRLARIVPAWVARQWRLCLAKVVGGVVVRTGVKVPRWAHPRSSDGSGGRWVCRQGAFAGSAALNGRVFSTLWWGHRGSTWVRKSRSVGEPACVSGRHGRLLGWMAVWLPRCSRVFRRCGDAPQGMSSNRASRWTSGVLLALRVFHRRVRSRKTRAPHARRRGERLRRCPVPKRRPRLLLAGRSHGVDVNQVPPRADMRFPRGVGVS
jgi:hypothetical protein